MTNHSVVPSAVLVAALAVAAGCTSAPRPPKGSGFLGDYSMLKQNPNYPDSWRWQKPGADLGEYDRLLIDPVEVRLAPGSEASAIPQTMTTRCAEEFTRILNEAIDPYYDLVQQAGPHTLHVRIALSDIMPDTSSPAGGVDVGGAALEAEVLDAVSGERLVAVMSKVEHAESLDAAGIPPNWKGIEGAFRVWAKRFLEFLENQGVGAAR